MFIRSLRMERDLWSMHSGLGLGWRAKVWKTRDYPPDYLQLCHLTTSMTTTSVYSRYHRVYEVTEYSTVIIQRSLRSDIWVRAPRYQSALLASSSRADQYHPSTAFAQREFNHHKPIMKLIITALMSLVTSVAAQTYPECTAEVARSDDCAAVINANACYNKFRWNAQTLTCIDGNDNAVKQKKVKLTG